MTWRAYASDLKSGLDRYIRAVVDYELAVHGDRLHFSVLGKIVRSRYHELASLSDHGVLYALRTSSHCVKQEAGAYAPRRVIRPQHGYLWTEVVEAREGLEQAIQTPPDTEKREAEEEIDGELLLHIEDGEDEVLEILRDLAPSTIEEAVERMDIQYHGMALE